jgi:hypothetical protein
MAAKRKSDVCDFLDDGRVKLVFGGAERILNRPTIGQLKKFNQMLLDIAKDQKDASTDASSLDIDSVVSSTLQWWSDVIDGLRDEDNLPCPSDLDDFPTWMMNTDLMVKIQNHWREVPWASGG